MSGTTPVSYFSFHLLTQLSLTDRVERKKLHRSLRCSVSTPKRTPVKLILHKTRKSSSDQSLSRVRLFATPCIAVHQTSLSFTISQSLLKLMSIHGSVMQSNHLILCRPFPLLPSIFPSIRVFSSESSLCIRLPNYWSFSSGISPSNECSRLISFRIDWFDLLAVQRTLKSLLQNHS